MTDANSSLRKEQEELDERLKSSLWYHVGRLVDEETLKLGVNATPQYIGTLTELVWLQIETISQDLESFATHAGRSTITTKDVMLLTRRNEGLRDILEGEVERLERGKGKGKKKP